MSQPRGPRGLKDWLSVLWSATRFDQPGVSSYAEPLMLRETRRGVMLMALLSCVMLIAALALNLRDTSGQPALVYVHTFTLLTLLALHVLISARAVHDIQVLHLLGMVLLVVSGAGFMLLAHRVGSLNVGLMANIVLLFMLMPLVPWGLREAATVIAMVYGLLTVSALSVSGRFDPESLWTFQFLMLAAAVTAVVLVARNIQVRKRDLEARFDLVQAREELERLSHVDPMTGAWNRRFLERSFGDLAREAHTENRHLCLALMDVDEFKSINDTWGHHFGDEILNTLAAVFRQHLPGNAYLIRLGGDEFAVLQAGDELVGLVHRCLRHLETHPELLRQTGGRPVLVSTGFATLSPGEPVDLQVLYRAADAELYHAKRARSAAERQAEHPDTQLPDARAIQR